MAFNMIRPLILLGILSTVTAKWTTMKETRTVETNGKTFKCVYNLKYKGALVINKKSPIFCSPDLKTKFTNTEYFEINGKAVVITHNIKKKMDNIVEVKVSELTTTPEPTTTTNKPSPGGGAMSCKCKMPMSPMEGMASGRAIGEVLTRHNNGGVSKPTGEGIFPLLLVFFVSLLAGFLGAALLGLLTPPASRDLTSVQKIDIKHASILRNLEESERQFGGFENNLAESVIQAIGQNPELMQNLVNAAIESGALENAAQQAAESGAIAEAMMAFIESGAIEEAIEEVMASGEIENALVEAFSGFNLEEMMNEMFTVENGIIMEEAFIAWFQDLINDIDPEVIEELMITVGETEVEMDCMCEPGRV